MALLAAVIAAFLLTGLGVSLVLLGSAGTALAAHDRRAVDAEYGADAALRLAISELRERTDWSGVGLAGAAADVCAAPGRLVDTTLFPAAPWDGSLIDLHTLTEQLQAAAAATAPPNVAAPVWRLFEYAPISRVIPPEPGRRPLYLAVWAADGGGGLVLLRALALGPSGARASLEASLARDGTGAAVQLAIRSAPAE
jgi:hypothetical protein